MPYILSERIGDIRAGAEEVIHKGAIVSYMAYIAAVATFTEAAVLGPNTGSTGERLFCAAVTTLNAVSTLALGAAGIYYGIRAASLTTQADSMEASTIVAINGGMGTVAA
jgi:hypothetical protein